MEKFGLKAIGTSALLGLLAASVIAQEVTFRVDVQLVRVLATVKTAAGALVGSLQKGDFTIQDNGVPQEIAIFERQTEQPLNVAILLDISASTGKDIKYETESLSRFLRAFVREGNPDDAAALYAFNYEVRKLRGFSRNSAAFESAMRSIKSEAGTSLYDAIYLVSEELEKREGRKVILLITDGGDTTSTKDFHAALEAAQLADAIIYSILVVPITNDAGRNIGGENALETMAQRTGGRVFRPSIGAALDRALEDVLRELRTQYLLGYYPKNVPASKERFHRLEVRVSDPDLRVSSRNGYYGEAAPKR